MTEEVIPLDTSDETKYEIKQDTLDCPILEQTHKSSLHGSLLQALSALLVANIDVLALSVAVVGAFVPLGVAGALYTGLEVGEGGAIREAATILCGLDRDRLGVASCSLELVEIIGAELAKRVSGFRSCVER
jgi:hypothetical protein